jgi:tRNA dimethylallyltransferase
VEEIRPVALVGATASGKSALALALARVRPEAEIVSVDSMGVYRGMDIGTAKATEQQRRDVRHHLVDVVEPSQEFTVHDFQRCTRGALTDIGAEGHRALLVGGTGLYLRAVVDDLELPGRYPEVARDLESEADEPGGVATLYSRLVALDPTAAARIEPNNRRRTLRALEVIAGSGRRFSSFGPGLDAYPPTPFVLVGLAFDAVRDDVSIEERLAAQLDAGLLDEVRRLRAQPGGLSRTARQALAYRELLAHLEEGVPLDEAVAEAVRRTKSFARRQWAWFRRDPRITWLDRDGDLLGQLLSVWDGTAPAHGSLPTGRFQAPLQVGD